MAKRAKDVDLLRVVDLLQEHITPALCRTVFGAVRKTERQRVWTLEALIRFWTAVVLRAPKALSQALVDSLEGRDPSFPRIVASPEAFFQRCRDLRPAFFAEVFRRFTARLITAVPPRYAAELAPVQARFGAVVVFDGSRLAAIAHRLKLLWDERAVVLPGCLLGVYDVGRGLCRQLYFSADAAASEMTRAKTALADLAQDTLVVGDRLYGTADFFAALAAQHCWGLVRRNRLLGLHKLQRLRRRRVQGGRLEDWLVQAGSGASAPRQLLRHIRWRRGGTRYELLTNVLAPTRLSAEEALVYNALRVAQSDGAAQVGVPPEDLSPAKLYPKVVTATFLYLHAQQWERHWRQRHPRHHLCVVAYRPRWRRTSLGTLHVERRDDHRRSRRFCPARRHWKSLTHVRGGRRFLAKLS